jgi:hypothetical protein
MFGLARLAIAGFARAGTCPRLSWPLPRPAWPRPCSPAAPRLHAPGRRPQAAATRAATESGLKGPLPGFCARSRAQKFSAVTTFTTPA